jgi:hypothetical protein
VAQAKKLSRRRFLAVGCGAICAAALGSGCTNQFTEDSIVAACPYGKVNDPYPGDCHRYVDLNGNGLCDLSESAAERPALVPATQPTAVVERAVPAAQPTAVVERAARTATRCPHRLVNDPYPGRCGRYVDRNRSGICDLSEPT